ncbi:MAG: alkaline phosphatase family protein [Bacteroidetes bacterium]|nr:alkaline phosphatase family protein [Bacteroidota bacterium]
MKRRDFLRTLGLATAGAVAAPYILPSGRLFASTGSRRVNHVVVCLFAGGVRNLESVQKIDGNLMPSILTGNEAISNDIAFGIAAMPTSPLALPLQKYGTLYKEFRFGEGPTGHYSAHAVALTGRYADTNVNLRESPKYPTVFELYRKHSSPEKNALNAWWISNSLGPYPYLNYSSYPGYGSLYGANFIQPTSFYQPQSAQALGNMRAYTQQQRTSRDKVRDFLDKNFTVGYDPNAAGVVNPGADGDRLRDFNAATLAAVQSGQYVDPWSVGPSNMNNDLYNMFFAEKVIQEFKPELLVVNMQDVDICHFDFTRYADSLHKADFAVAKLWQAIQATPGMANDTVLIVVPEHGRNQVPNTVIDQFGRYAIDHTAIDQTSGDQMSREIFCLVVGPPGVVRQDQVITQVRGESIDIVPTVAQLLGFDTDIPVGVRPPGQNLGDAFL